MRRRLRLSWVLVANSIAIWLLYKAIEPVLAMNVLLEQSSKNRSVWLSFAVQAAFPILGILLELIKNRAAWWVNLGFFLYYGIAYTAAGALAWPDHHAIIAIMIGVPALVSAAITYLLYRENPRASAQHFSPAGPGSKS